MDYNFFDQRPFWNIPSILFVQIALDCVYDCKELDKWDVMSDIFVVSKETFSSLSVQIDQRVVIIYPFLFLFPLFVCRL